MPDWSYQTVFRPLLFRLPFESARDLSLGFMGRLVGLPFGQMMIRLLGHMKPDGQLSRNLAGLTVDSPVGLGAGIDTRNVAIRALSSFGFGLLEVGPLDLTSAQPDQRIEVNTRNQTLIRTGSSQACSVETLRNTLERTACKSTIILRIVLPSSLDGSTQQVLKQILRDFAALIDGISLSVQSDETDKPIGNSNSAVTWLREIRTSGFTGQIFQVCTPETAEEFIRNQKLAVDADQFSGLLIDGSEPGNNGTIVMGAGNFDRVLNAVMDVRDASADVPVLATGGVHAPGQAVRLLKAGANVVLLDSGLVFTGPGLPKRINEAALHLAASSGNETSKVASSSMAPSWFWTLLLAVAMLGGGTLAMSIATTRVVLPYDEAFVGMTRDELCGVNDRLLPFLTHDRVTLAGTMLADGILFLALSLFGIRAGFKWARSAIIASAMVGFFTFFLFLGFGYFDPFHAFVTAVLFQFVLFAIHSNEPLTMRIDVPDLTNDRAWRRGLAGQLIYILHGASILVGGCVICSFGVTSVFVQEDLEFMQTSVEALSSASPRLIPMIAHDRASFGGMLISCGLCVLLSSLWGFRRGAAWLWWALLLAGLLAYGSTIAVHHAVGYTSLKHLLPAYGGLLALLLGSVLSAPWMLDRRQATLCEDS